MKQVALFLLLIFQGCYGQVKMPLAGVPQRQIVPLEVMQRARVATQKVVDDTVKGNFPAVLAKMNPAFLKAIARPFGGVKKFEAEMLKMMQQMGKNGIAVQAIITQNPTTALEVDYGFQDLLVNGKPVMEMVDGKMVAKKEEFACYRQWMVFVPTVMDVFVKDKEAKPPVLRKVRKWDFQIAISPKRNENWTFVSGSRINPLQLRKVFPFLPKNEKDFQFPPVKIKEITEVK